MDFDFSELWKMFQPAAAGMRAGATIYGGYQQKAAADLSASGLESAGDQAVAASQRRAQEELRRSKLLSSRALAVAAASGAGASDPTVVDIISGIAGEGAYRSELALYEGREAKRAMDAKADAARYQGKQARGASYINAATSFGKTMFDKYGGGGPDGGLTDAWDTSPMRDYKGFD